MKADKKTIELAKLVAELLNQKGDQAATPKAQEKAKAWNSDEERNAFLGKARDAWFKKMGYGPYSKKAQDEAKAKAKPSKTAEQPNERDLQAVIAAIQALTEGKKKTKKKATKTAEKPQKKAKAKKRA